MDNYEITLQSAMKRFCSYDMKKICAKAGVTDCGDQLTLCFLGSTVQIQKGTGAITVDGAPGDFCEGLSVFDWLCDGKEDAKASGEFCPVSSLSRVYVSGSGLAMTPQKLADAIDKAPEQFEKACNLMGGKKRQTGDIGYEIEIFQGISVLLKFYFSDGEFPAHITFLWDQNILQFVRYETVYYIAACLNQYLLRRMTR